jgi:transcriptional regulator with XRE-family HTH domain
MNIEKLAERVLNKRGGDGVRKAAEEVGIGSATLSRIENGKVPDLETFSKICRWLGDDPAIYLGSTPATTKAPSVQVHFKKETAIKPETAKALSQMILRAHEALIKEDEIPQ